MDALDGALVVDKPGGLTSHDVVSKIKRYFRLEKVGHAGTLDPLATGVLVILIGRATKLQSFFLESDKAYEGIIRLGVATTTDDIAGEKIADDASYCLPLGEAFTSLRDRIQREFIGEIKQLPPAYSALKLHGVPAYKRARRGEETVLQPRSIVVRHLEITRHSDTQLSYKLCCSKGTYVRALARDIGVFLGTSGCVETLRRTGSGRFGIVDTIPLSELLELPELSAANLLTIDDLVSEFPKLVFGASVCEALRRGDQSALSALEVRVERYAECGENGSCDIAVFAKREPKPLASIIYNGDTGRAEGIAELRVGTGRFQIRAML